MTETEGLRQILIIAAVAYGLCGLIFAFIVVHFFWTSGRMMRMYPPPILQPPPPPPEKPHD